MGYIKKHTYFFIRTFFIGCYFFLSTYKISAQELSIYGWPDTTMPRVTPYFGFGDEPVIGRLTCPPLTRYNHSTQKSEALIVVPVMHSELLWEYKLRQGIYWWDGSIVTANNLLSFFKKNMTHILSEKGLDDKKTPNYEFIPSQNSLKIKWHQAPKFGIYFLDGISLTREPENLKTSKLAYECVGNFYPQDSPIDNKQILLNLVPVKAYSYSRSNIKFYKHANKSSKNLKKSLSFQFPGDEPVTHTRLSLDKQRSCVKASLPYASVLIWNLEHPLSSQEKFRKLLSQLIPYNQIISQAASGYGKYIDSVISEEIYLQNRKQTSPPAYNVKSIQDQLLKHGFLEPDAKSVSQGQRQLKVSIQNSPLTSDLIEKVLADSFGAAGIHIKFDSLASEKHIARLQSLNLPNLSTNALGFWRKIYPNVKPEKVPSFDQFLTNIALFNQSLSLGQADLDLARKIINKSSEMILITPILQHAACIESMGLSIPKNSAEYLNPDWLRNIIKGL